MPYKFPKESLRLSLPPYFANYLRYIADKHHRTPSEEVCYLLEQHATQNGERSRIFGEEGEE